MSKQKNEIIYHDKNRWKNLNTNEIIETDEVIKSMYLTAIVQLIDSLGNKKMQVVKYILENMDKSTNILFITTRELTKKSKISRQTVIHTLKTLEQAQIITRKTEAIIIYPSLVPRRKN
ncbi:replication/maintenance protein RepL [Bacillus mycoides]|uniref:replication/maintenance protein RepL n=1 Tax=Bacillus mycoides TaxID=1405 RepID=UPI0011A3C46A|nr:replication/maintenance protein RepL [Bacillus mycoides]